MEIINTLGIDLPLIIAQMVNFGILVAVLTFFVYRPILRLIDQRREAVRQSMEDADVIRRQRDDVEQARKAEILKIEKEAAMLLDQAKADVLAAKNHMIAEARKEADEALLRGKQQLQAEAARVTLELEQAAASLVVKLTGKLLSKEFTAADQDRLVASLEHSLSTPHHAKK